MSPSRELQVAWLHPSFPHLRRRFVLRFSIVGGGDGGVVVIEMSIVIDVVVTEVGDGVFLADPVDIVDIDDEVEELSSSSLSSSTAAALRFFDDL